MESESFFMTDWMGKPAWMWLGFLVVVALLMILDLGVLHRDSKIIGVRQSLVMCAGYTLCALLFGAGLGWMLGGPSSLLYITGYVVEFSLSLDNVFVMALIISAFKIPRALQHRVLFWGILGAIILRGIMILAGAALVQEFHWVLYLFAAFLVVTGIKMLVTKEEEEKVDLKHNRLLTFLRTYGRVTDELHGDRFFVRIKDQVTGKMARYMTPLMLALILIEVADVVFAVDSVPAIFAITTDPYLVFTSNILAIMGLRSLYFALSALMERFAYLKYALALVLIFIGGKIGVAGFGIHIEEVTSLLITVSLLGGGMAFSWWKTARSGA